MAARSLEKGNLRVARPYQQPIARVGHMALVASSPPTGQRVHIMPTAQFVYSFR